MCVYVAGYPLPAYPTLLLPVGTPAVTSRLMKEAEMQQVAIFLDEGVEIAATIKASLKKGSKDPSYKVKIFDT